jgi:hypothetical protein
MTDFRALCAELVENLERYQCWYIEDNGYGIPDLEALLRRASAALAQPEPQGPTDEELRDLWSWAAGQDQGPWPTQQHCFARAVLARWNRPTIKPVLVAERLPGPEDCDAKGRCWVWNEGSCRWWEWVSSKMISYSHDDYTHWLPHHALPVPQQEGAND